MGVSRQAVSKWETGQTTPDMDNLLALSVLFGVPLEDLTATPAPEAPPRNWRRLALLLLAAVIGAVMLAVYLRSAPENAVPEGLSDFTLLWGDGQYLSLGAQESLFPFGTSLVPTAQESTYTGDFHHVTYHDVVCGGLILSYAHIDEETETREVVSSMKTISPDFRTPRGISVGSTKAQVLEAYGGQLVYAFKEDIAGLIRHDYYYIYANEGGSTVLIFYMKDGLVAGIRLEALGDGAGLYDVDNISRFPLSDGEPDFSLRMEPEEAELWELDATNQVYIALHRLTNWDNQSAEEVYQTRRALFASLKGLNWELLPQMNSEENVTVSLTNWLVSQQVLSRDELRGLILGCDALSGDASSGYGNALFYAVFRGPVRFVQALGAVPADTAQTALDLAIRSADSSWQSEFPTMKRALEDAYFTGGEQLWADQLLAYLDSHAAPDA